MPFKNFGPFGLLVLSFIVLLSQGTFSEAKPETEAAAPVAAVAPLSQGGLKEPLAVESGPAKTRVARRGGSYGGGRSMGMHGGGGRGRFPGARRFRGHHQRMRHSRPSYYRG